MSNVLKELAKKFIQDKNYTWNSGIYMAKASTIINEVEKFVPEINFHCKESLDKKIKDLDFSEEQKMQLRENLKEAIRQSIDKAFRLMKDYLVSTQAQANNNHGLWSQPNGDKYYELRIRTYTTTDYSPQEIHDMGLSEVERVSNSCLLYTSPSPRDQRGSRMP